MYIEERHQEILNLLKQNGRISCGEIQEKFGISYESVKRDLRILEENGLLQRTYGGAIPVRQVATSKPSKMTCKDMTEIKENYFAIAMKAVSMIQNNEVIFITSASLGYFMAQNLPHDMRLRVVTNSIILAEELRKRDNISVILLGGEMDNKGNCYDAIAVETIKRLQFDKSFLTSAGISPKFGLSLQRTQAISFYNSLIDNSKQVIGMYPTEKIGFNSIVSICPSSRLTTLITDWDANEDDVTAFAEQGVDVIVLDKEEIAEQNKEEIETTNK